MRSSGSYLGASGLSFGAAVIVHDDDIVHGKSVGARNFFISNRKISPFFDPSLTEVASMPS